MAFHLSSTSLRVWVLTGGLLTLLVASFFPIWTVWYWNPWEGLGVRASLWGVLWKVLRCSIREPDPNFPVTCNPEPRELIVAAIVFVVGAVGGAFVYFLRQR